MLLSQIHTFATSSHRDPADWSRLVRKVATKDRAFVKLALRAAGAVGELPAYKAECVEMLERFFTD